MTTTDYAVRTQLDRCAALLIAAVLADAHREARVGSTTAQRFLLQIWRDFDLDVARLRATWPAPYVPYVPTRRRR